jgi:hypothetical protein
MFPRKRNGKSYQSTYLSSTVSVPISKKQQRSGRHNLHRHPIVASAAPPAQPARPWGWWQRAFPPVERCVECCVDLGRVINLHPSTSGAAGWLAGV